MGVPALGAPLRRGPVRRDPRGVRDGAGPSAELGIRVVGCRAYWGSAPQRVFPCSFESAWHLPLGKASTPSYLTPLLSCPLELKRQGFHAIITDVVVTRAFHPKLESMMIALDQLESTELADHSLRCGLVERLISSRVAAVRKLLSRSAG